jgi:carnitine 3-dehydrogenase
MAYKVTKAAAIGGGVIGGGWIARFLLNGIDVNVYDPHPQAQRVVGEVLENAERAYRLITGGALPLKGSLHFCSSIAEAVAGADYVQESVPEREELKHSILREIDQHAAAEALLGSSTSGLLPSRLQSVLAHPERFFVAHPFNPVYLLPLVELVPGARTEPGSIERASAFLDAIGMKPLVVRKEIDAHIADRLLEAVWREGLWLIKDGVANTEEIDDAIRFGFGLRWAQMGLFETYRIAGGEAGMRHFIGQFGPCLQWPWSRLTDVPELDDALVETIASQSDAQSGRYSVRELERIRDENLVAIMRGLATREWGAGATYKRYAEALVARAQEPRESVELGGPAPLQLLTTTVHTEWTDYNGHMTEYRYLELFGDATDAFLLAIGMDPDYLASGLSVYTVETHIRHLREVAAGQLVHVQTRLLGYDKKRIRVLHEMIGGPEEALLATAEHMLLHVNSAESKASEMRSPLTEELRRVWEGHADMPTPDYTGRGIRTEGAPTV